MKTKILADFQICIGVPLKLTIEKLTIEKASNIMSYIFFTVYMFAQW